MATLAAYDIHSNLKAKGLHNVEIGCYTFAAPRTGNYAFARQYNAVVPNTWSVINDQVKASSIGMLQAKPSLQTFCRQSQACNIMQHVGAIVGNGQVRQDVTSLAIAEVHLQPNTGLLACKDLTNKPFLFFVTTLLPCMVLKLTGNGACQQVNLVNSSAVRLLPAPSPILPFDVLAPSRAGVPDVPESVNVAGCGDSRRQATVPVQAARPACHC